MGYEKRPTKGWVNCRPEEFRDEKHLPKPGYRCNENCPYYPICNKRGPFMKNLKKRLQDIRINLGLPYHFFKGTSDRDEDVMLVLEDDEGNRKQFRGKSMVGAVKEAEDYIEQFDDRPT